MSPRLRHAGALGIVVFLLAIAGLATVAILTSWPATRVAPPRAGSTLDAVPLRQALAPEALDPLLQQIAGCGRRALGTPGLERTADLITSIAREVGAEVLELPVRTPRPVTRAASLVPVTGAAPAGLTIYPFKPNLIQPGITPPGGITGKLVLIDAAWEESGAAGAGNIALIDAAQSPPKRGMAWATYAAHGFSALVVTHAGGLEAIDWKDICAAAESQTPICFPRVAATPAVLALAGAEVRLDVEIAWETVVHRALLARLKPAAGSTGQALAISVPYDQVAALPDLTPSADQDLPLATALAAFRALAASRDQLGRDVLLIAAAGGENGDDGIAWLLSAAGTQQGGTVGRDWWVRRVAELSAREAVLGRLFEVLRTPGLLRDASAAEAALAGLGADEAEALAGMQRQVINDRVAELDETALQARIAMLRAAPAPGAVPPAALLDAYIVAKQGAGRVSTIASWPLAGLVRRAAPLVVEHDLDGRLVRWLTGVSARVRDERLQAEAAVRIGSLFAGFSAVLAFEPRPVGASESEQVAVHRGQDLAPGTTGQAFSELCQRLAAEAGAEAPALKPMSGGSKYTAQVDAAIARLPLHAAAWSGMGYAAMALVHADRAADYRRLTAPAAAHPVTPPRRFLRLTADLLGLLAAGRGEVPMPQRPSVRGWAGQVLASGIGAGLVPSHPLAEALVGAQPADRPAEHYLVGHGMNVVMRADDRGHYRLPPGPFRVQPRWMAYRPLVAGFAADGLLRWVKDGGSRAQALFRSDEFKYSPPERINIVAFRADPVVITDRIDPRLLRPWAEIRPLTRDGLAAPASLAAWDGTDGLSVFFLQPDRFAVFTLNAGSPENPLVRSVRSVLLGTAVPSGTRLTETQPDGMGYLPADRPWIARAANEAAASLLRLDARKLKQQVEQGLARPGMTESAEAAQAALDKAAAEPDATTALTAARRAGALAQQNHERIQTSISQAVANIVWYLCLLVPFALFTEKLVVGSSDVRRQIMWSGIIFLTAFGLLALLHPAFPLLASPAMILLGFVTMLIALGVSGVFLGRFQENLKSLQAGRGQVDGARVDVLGVTMTAFLLGLNGLSRRKVRTGLTSATLVLITFALICFAGIQRVQGVAVTAVGPAAYQGMLVTDETRGQIEPDEVSALRSRYGREYRVCERSTLVGTEEMRTRERGNPQLDLVRGAGDDRRVARGTGALLWQHEEPLAGRLRLVAGRPWSEVAPAGEAPMPVMLSEASAEALRITPAELAAGPVPATLNGQAVAVTAIFASDSLAGLRDLDGRSPLPFDIEAMLTIRRSRTNAIIAYPDDPLLPATQMMILPRTGLTAPVPSSERRLVSCAVALDRLPYREANEVIADHQRLSGMPLAYGLDGTAFVGRPRQAGGFGGVDLLIPLLIAALTVLNTMRGSVYERRDEIAVFNAVGIAPRYIAAMFFAEALVYAVVGAVAGFLLSLLLGRGLAMLGLDAGLKLDVASLAPVYASLALAAAVFLSTWFPARQAAEIAAPSDDSGWKMPAPEGDRMTIELPFVFDKRDRLGVLAFFARWFRDHGEGGAGLFQAAEPVLSAERVAGAAVPRIATRIWLKPFDQGVAQELRIELRPDANGEHLALLTIERTSGSRDAWLRLNRPFMGELRRHFLYWRAVDPAMRAELFTEAGTLLRAAAEETNHV
jgi:hypothetical protein